MVLTAERLREIARELGEAQVNRSLSDAEVQYLYEKLDALLDDWSHVNLWLLAIAKAKETAP